MKNTYQAWREQRLPQQALDILDDWHEERTALFFYITALENGECFELSRSDVLQRLTGGKAIA